MMDRRAFLRSTSLALAGGLVVGDAALALYDRLTHRKVWALGAMPRRTVVMDGTKYEGMLTVFGDDQGQPWRATHIRLRNGTLWEAPKHAWHGVVCHDRVEAKPGGVTLSFSRPPQGIDDYVRAFSA